MHSWAVSSTNFEIELKDIPSITEAMYNNQQQMYPTFLIKQIKTIEKMTCLILKANKARTRYK